MKGKIVNEKFIERCNLLKDEKGVSLENIESQIGISKGMMSKYMNGIHLPNSEVIKNLSKFFETTSDYLLGTSDIRKQEYNVSSIPSEYIDIINDAINNNINVEELKELLEVAKKIKSSKR
jgi:transcriptional regulator with XRE-family HTH domain